MLTLIAVFDEDFRNFMDSLKPKTSRIISLILIVAAIIYLILAIFLINFEYGFTGNIYEDLQLYFLFIPLGFFITFVILRHIASWYVRKSGANEKLDFSMAYTASEFIPWFFLFIVVFLLGSFLSLSFYQEPFRAGLNIFIIIASQMLPYMILYVILWVLILSVGRNTLERLYALRFKGLLPRLNLIVSLGRGIQPIEVSGTLNSIGRFLVLKRDKDEYMQQIPWRSIASLAVLPKARPENSRLSKHK
jgi:hypothetical protein